MKFTAVYLGKGEGERGRGRGELYERVRWASLGPNRESKRSLGSRWFVFLQYWVGVFPVSNQSIKSVPTSRSFFFLLFVPAFKIPRVP